MDEIVKKAFETADLMSSLANQKFILKEEFSQNLIYYFNGGSFTVTKELINFVKCLIDLGHTDHIVLVDDNDTPIDVDDSKVFLDNILNVYFNSVNEYYSKYSQLKKSRSIESILK